MNCWPWVILHMLGRIEDTMAELLDSVLEQCSSDSIKARSGTAKLVMLVKLSG